MSRICFFLVACTSWGFAQTKQVQFKTFSKDDLDVFKEVGSDAFTLGVSIQGADQNTAFLYGNFYGNGVSAHKSLILRTDNGGKTWHEVFPAQISNSIVHLAFPTAKIGYAIQMFDVEGPGAPEVWRTVNGGKTWKLVKELPRKTPYDSFVGASFTSPLSGTVYITCNVGSTEEDQYQHFTTKDGGKTWRESTCYKKSAESFPKETSHPTRDNYIWELAEMNDHDRHIRVLRYFVAQQQKTVVAELPHTWVPMGGTTKMLPKE